MPKIIKNGKEYSGVPIEVVTAWAPTADPVQVKEPLMGNTDISNIGDGTVTGAIDGLKTGLTQLGKIYRFEATGGAVSANGRIPFTNSYVADNSIYVDGTSIKFRRSGTVRIDINITASVSSRLWLLIHGNLNHHFISYGEYATCTSSIVVQVSDTFEFYITAKEACTVNGGSTSPATVFFTWLS